MDDISVKYETIHESGEPDTGTRLLNEMTSAYGAIFAAKPPKIIDVIPGK